MTSNNSCIIKERDPCGLDAHTPGAKLDAGKCRPHLVYKDFIHALQEVFKNGTFGADKYSDSGWKSVPNASARYLDAFHRHYDKYLLGEIRDLESGTHHLGAAAWNLLAVLELELTTGGAITTPQEEPGE